MKRIKGKFSTYYKVAILALIVAGCAPMKKNSSLQDKNTTSFLKNSIETNSIGDIFGRELSSGARKKAVSAGYLALEYTAAGSSVHWENQETFEKGEIIPAQPYRVGSQDCRQFLYILFNKNGSNILSQTACRNPNGVWGFLP